MFHDDGQLWIKENYKNGKKHGVQVWYYENGQLWTKENYKNGKHHGLQEYYDENGQLEEIENYKDGDGMEFKSFISMVSLQEKNIILMECKRV